MATAPDPIERWTFDETYAGGGRWIANASRTEVRIEGDCIWITDTAERRDPLGVYVVPLAVLDELRKRAHESRSARRGMTVEQAMRLVRLLTVAWEKDGDDEWYVRHAGSYERAIAGLNYDGARVAVAGQIMTGSGMPTVAELVERIAQVCNPEDCQ